MDQTQFNELCSQLEEKIKEFKSCTELSEKGLLMNTAYKMTNSLLNEIKNDQSQPQFGKLAKVNQLKSDLTKAHKLFLHEVDFTLLKSDAHKLHQALQLKKINHKQLRFLISEVENECKRIDMNRLGSKDKKFYDDSLELIGLAQIKASQHQQNQNTSIFSADQSQIINQSQKMESFHDQTILKEIQQYDDEEDRFFEILKNSAELNRLQANIQAEGYNQQIQVNNLEENVSDMNKNIDKAETEYILAHKQEMQRQQMSYIPFFRRRTVMQGIIASIFAVFSAFKGFGLVIGGALGLYTGKIVANVSQAGLDAKIEKSLPILNVENQEHKPSKDEEKEKKSIQ